MSEYADIIDLNNKAKEIVKSYMTKEEYINMISNLNFEYVREASIDLITNIYIENDDIKILYKQININ